MDNFLTKAASDVWEIFRKKLPESFGMQWGVPDTAKNMAVNTAKALPATGFNPVTATGVGMASEWARKGLNAYSNLPTISPQDASKLIQGRLAMSGLGPSFEEKESRPASPTLASTPNLPTVTRRPQETPLTSTLVTQPSPIGLPAPVDRGVSLAKDMINNGTAFNRDKPISDVTFTTTGQSGLGPRSEAGGGGQFPGYRPSDFTLEAMRNLKDMEAKGTTWTGELTAARNLVLESIRADIGSYSGQQNYDVARRRLNQPMAVTGFEGEEHATDLFYPESGERKQFFRGALPKEANVKEGVDREGKDLRKLMGDLILKEFESDLKTSSDFMTSPEDKKAAQGRISARKSMFQGGASKPTFEQFQAAAQNQGSRMSDSQLKQAYKERYGR